MDITNPLNTKILSYLARGKFKNTPAFAPWSALPDPWDCCCHGDIVEYFACKIAPALPADCLAVVHSDPALVHPKSGVIFAICLGTEYGLRLPGLLAAEATQAGAKTFTKWSTGDVMDIRRELGEDWVFGAWLPNELIWCKKVYEIFDRAT
jgi:hypothetical protein